MALWTAHPLVILASACTSHQLKTLLLAQCGVLPTSVSRFYVQSANQSSQQYGSLNLAQRLQLPRVWLL
jgi:hypothetical protein